jgi:hypothetical protein
MLIDTSFYKYQWISLGESFFEASEADIKGKVHLLYFSQLHYNAEANFISAGLVVSLFH